MLFITKLSQISVLLQMVLHVRKVCVFYEAFLCFECEHSTTVHLMATGGDIQLPGNLEQSCEVTTFAH